MVQMLGRRRAAFVFVLLIAAAIAFEPLIHTHPLSQRSTVPCAVCVAAVGMPTSLAPAGISPLVLVFIVASAVATVITRRAYIPLASRAPPSA
jgi:hypothetical protein